MDKQTVGSSTDRWQQRPSSRGSGLLALPSHNQPGASIPPSGIVSGAGSGGGGGGSTATSSHPHHQHHQQLGAQGQSHHPSAHPQQHHPSQPLPRKKSVVVCGAKGGGQQHQPPPGREEHVMSPPTGGMNSQQGGAHGTSGDITIATAIVHQQDSETLELCSRNPLLCLICNNVYEDPRLLSCYHSFCAKCLPGRLGDAKLVCPVCGKPTALKDGSGPQSDHLLRFLLHSSPNIHPSCANCDNKNRAPMYYCNTCGQILCDKCRVETHRAKMFSTHDIVPVSKHIKDTPKKCSIHREPYIMFSNVQKTMLCINCYRDTATDLRLHCVDLETAYSQGCRKLDRAAMSLRDLQVAVRDGITMLKNVLEELRRNSDSEKSAVNAVCQTILDALTMTQENLLKDVDCQTDGKDKVIRGQLCQLRSVLPTIKLHLTMCATVSNATNKYDFLDLAYPLIDRLTAISHMGYPIRPGQSSQIKSTYKSEMARTLEPWVSGGHSSSHTTYKSPHLHKDYTHPADPSLGEPIYSQYYPMSRSTVTPVMRHKSQVGGGHATPAGAAGLGPSSGRKTPVARSEGVDEHFVEHCRSFTAHINELNQRLSRLKEQVQELHRDVTLQRGTAHSVRADVALREGLFLQDQLERRHSEMERIRKHLERHWNDNIRQIRMEQEVFQSQMNDLLAMKSEVKKLSKLLQQLQSFLKSLKLHPPQPQQSGGGGPGGAQGGAGGGGNVAGPSGTGNLGTKSGAGTSSSGQGGQTNRQTQHHVHHMTTTALDPSSRTHSGSQVTPSLGEVVSYLDQAKVSMGPSQKSDPNRLSGRSFGAPSSTGKQSIQQPSSFVPRPCYQQKQPTQAEEYIQVDTSYSHPPHHQPPSSKIGHSLHPNLTSLSDASMKKGVLSQLIDKVRLKDDRKKSCASGVSSSSSGGTQPVIPPSASALAARRALKMYDAQCQFGLESSNSAVSALALANSNFNKVGVQSGESFSFSHQRHESRPTYQRAKSFVKSKSDDERPPSKLSHQARARSAGQLETESLLRSLSSGSKDASRIVELYQSLSKTIMERENQQFQRASYPQSYNPYSPTYFDTRSERYGASNFMGTVPPKSSSGGGNSYPRGQSNSLGRIHRSQYRPEESLTPSEDDYQPILFNRSLPVARSHSAPPRKPNLHQGSSSGHIGTALPTEVKVFVHEEPFSTSRHTQSSPPSNNGTLSKSLEESYLYDYMPQQHRGGLTSSSSGHSGVGSGSAFTAPSVGKKSASMESLVSLGGDAEEQSRKSSIDFDRRSVVTVRRAGSKSVLMTRQHSWEGGAQLSGKREHSKSTPHLSPTTDDPFDPFESGRSSVQSAGEGDGCGGGASSASNSRRRSTMYDDDDEDDLLVGNTLHKADSFEGHEEAVRSIVAAVVETRTLQRRLQSN